MDSYHLSRNTYLVEIGRVANKVGEDGWPTRIPLQSYLSING